MDNPSAPASPTFEFKTSDDTSTFEFLDEGSPIPNRKRRRSSLRRVSFAEQPSIHVFARDDEYETPPEGTENLSTNHSSQTMSRSPQRRSGRLSARSKDNDMDKENMPMSVGSNEREWKRGKRPPAVKEADFLKPPGWLDVATYTSGDDNTGPVDLRHISFPDLKMSADDDDNMTMDSQTFQTRISLMNSKQALEPLTEENYVDVATPQYTDMSLTIIRPPTGRQHHAEPQETWHPGEDTSSDMSLTPLYSEHWKGVKTGPSIAKDESVHEPEENGKEAMSKKSTPEEKYSHPQTSRRALEAVRLTSRDASDDTASLEIASDSKSSEKGLEVQVKGTSVPEEHSVSHEAQQYVELKRMAALKGSDDTVSEDATLHSQASRDVDRVATLDNFLNASRKRRASSADQGIAAPSNQDEWYAMEGDASNLESVGPLPDGNNKESKRALALLSKTTSQSHPNRVSVEPGRTSLPADDETVSMDITPLKENEELGSINSRPGKRIDFSAAFNLLNTLEAVDMAGAEAIEEIQDGTVEKIPSLRDPVHADIQTREDCNMTNGTELKAIVFDRSMESQRGSMGEVEIEEGREQVQVTLSNRILENATLIPDLSNGRNAKEFRNPEDPFSFKVSRDSSYRKDAKESPIREWDKGSASSQQEETSEPTASKVLERIFPTNANLRDHQDTSQPDFEQDPQNEDFTEENVSQQNWREAESSDMSTTSLSPTRPKSFFNSILKAYPSPAGIIHPEAELTDSPSEITAAVAYRDVVQDHDASESSMRNLTWSAQHLLGQDEKSAPMRQPLIEDEAVQIFPSNPLTPESQNRIENKEDSIFTNMTEEAEHTLKGMSHTKETQNSAACKIMQRLMHLKNQSPLESGDGNPFIDGSPQILRRRSLIFHALSDSQPQERSPKQSGHWKTALQRELEEGDSPEPMSTTFHHTSGRKKAPVAVLEELRERQTSAVKVDSTLSVTEESGSRRWRIEASKRGKLAQDLKEADEKLASLDRRSAEPKTYQELYRTAADWYEGRDQSMRTIIRPAVTQGDRLKSRCFYLEDMEVIWQPAVKRTGDEVIHEFNYFSFITHRVHERRMGLSESTVTRSTIDLNAEAIDKVFTHMNASQAFQALLSGHETKAQLHSMRALEQLATAIDGDALLQSKTQSLNQLAEQEPSEVVDRPRLVTVMHDEGDVRYLATCIRKLMQYPDVHLPCEVEIEYSGWYGKRLVTAAEIQDTLASVSPGPQHILRICSSVTSLLRSIRAQPLSDQIPDGRSPAVV